MASQVAHMIPEDILEGIDLQQCLQDLREYGKLGFLVCGKTGVGKSTLINGLVGQEVRNVNDPGLGDYSSATFGPGTTEVEETLLNIDGVLVSVWDSPGLQDDTNSDEKYLENMYANCKNVDLVLYCVDMTTARWTPREVNATKLLTKKFGVEFWKRCILVMTKANMVRVPRSEKGKENEYFKRLYYNFMQQFQQQLITQGVVEDTARSVPAVAVGLYDVEIPDERFLWYVSNHTAITNEKQDSLAELWVTSFETVSRNSREKFIRATARQRIQQVESDGQPQTADQKKLVELLLEKIETQSQLIECLKHKLEEDSSEKYQKELQKLRKELQPEERCSPVASPISIVINNSHVERMAVTMENDKISAKLTEKQEKTDVSKKQSIMEALFGLIGGIAGGVIGCFVGAPMKGVSGGKEIGRHVASGFVELYNAIKKEE